jgi:hypothetical protein
MEKVALRIVPEGTDLVIRQGAAVPVFPKSPVTLAGTIRSVLNWEECYSEF